ncbi:MAG: hypothetical protein K2I45_11245 [Muribaculaceae bacterium]|nr:hypothetical protein [Muribaculaceae bacterium]
MVTRDRSRCAGCRHFTVVRTINHPEGEMSCRFAIVPCDTCRRFADSLDSGEYKSAIRKKA